MCGVTEKHLVSGAKQTLRVLRSGAAREVYIARDASPQVTEPITTAAKEAGVPVVPSPSMRELGRLCGIAVGCSCAARLKSPASCEEGEAR